MSYIQKLIQNLISQRIILENEIENVTIECDRNGCLIITYAPTGEILFNSCNDVNGAAGVVGPIGQTGPTLTGQQGSIGTIGVTTIGPTGFNGNNGNTGQTGATGFIGSIGFQPVGQTGRTGATGATGATGPIGFSPPGVNIPDKLNFPILSLIKNLSDRTFGIFPDNTVNVNDIPYDSILDTSLPSLYSTVTNIFTVPYTGYYYINSSIYLTTTSLSSTAYGYIQYKDSTTTLSTGTKIFSTIVGGFGTMQLQHEDIISLTAGTSIYFKVVFYGGGGAGSSTWRALVDTDGDFSKTPISSKLFLNMTNA